MRVERRSLAGLVLLAVAPAAMTSCGSSDQEQVAATVKRFYRAAAHGDAKAACDQLTPSARGSGGGAQCESTIEQLGRLGGAATKRRLEGVAVRHVRVEDDEASAEAQIETQTPIRLRLLELDGTWKLDSLGAQPGGSL